MFLCSLKTFETLQLRVKKVVKNCGKCVVLILEFNYRK